MDQSATRLAGVRAVVTCATSGLGRAMAEALAADGARVAVKSRDWSRAQEPVICIGTSSAGFPLDVRSVQSVRTLDLGRFVSFEDPDGIELELRSCTSTTSLSFGRSAPSDRARTPEHRSSGRR